MGQALQLPVAEMSRKDDRALPFRESGTNAVIAQGQFDAGAIAQIAGSSRLAARGTLNVLCGVHYGAVNGGKVATLTLTIRATDDRGSTVTQEIVVPVTST